MSLPGPSREAAERVEVERIRAAYAERDGRGPRHPAIAAASQRLNDQRLAYLLPLLRSAAAPPAGRLLDVGCGSGGDLARWIAAGWQARRLAGVELVPARLARARATCPEVDLRLTEGPDLPYRDDSFDVAVATTVFSSIQAGSMRRRLFGEMARVVRPGGLVVVYDFMVRRPGSRGTIALNRRRLEALAGRPPDGSIRLSPLLQAVALASLLGPWAEDLAMRSLPKTHRLAWWRVGGGSRRRQDPPVPMTDDASTIASGAAAVSGRRFG